MSQHKLAALDTNVLLHLAENYAPAHNLVRRLVKMGYTPIITQTVIQELGYCVDHGSTVKKRAAAEEALSSLRSWGVQPYTLKPVGNGICDIAADLIAGRGLLPEEEKNDAYLVIEAGLCGVALFLTWDSHLTEADNDGLNGVLDYFDLARIKIQHPREILGYTC